MTNKSGSLENEILEFHDFPGFKWPVPCLRYQRVFLGKRIRTLFLWQKKLLDYMMDYIWRTIFDGLCFNEFACLTEHYVFFWSSIVN